MLRVAKRGVGRVPPALVLAVGMVWGSAAYAGPWLELGDERLRHDLQLLADAGVIELPLQSWPLPAADVSYALGRVSHGALETRALQRALTRVRSRVRRESHAGRFESHLGGALAANPEVVRGFGAGPREEAEIDLALERMGQRLAGRLQVQWVHDPDDGEDYRFDGSYVGAILGNWILSVDAHQRWWGPGRDGSLILSDNARPFPRVTVQRNYSDAPETPWLSWIGPWRVTAFLGRLEHDREPRSPTVFGTRLEHQPLASLDLGVSSVALFGGGDRDGDPGTLLDVYTEGDSADPEDVAGMHVTALDGRLRIPFVPVAVYGQLARQAPEGGSGEDEMALYGTELTLSLGDRGHSLGVFVEHADLTDLGEQPFYEQLEGPYDGYTHYDRSLGHSLTGEGRMTTLGLTYVTPAGDNWEVRGRIGERGSGGVSDDIEDYSEITSSFSRRFRDGSYWGVGLGWRERGTWPLTEGEDEEWYGRLSVRRSF